MDSIHVTLVQANLVWEDAPANRRHLAELAAKAAHPTDVIVLPEMFSTGFSMNAEKLAEAPDGATVQWMLALAKAHDALVVGSLIIKEGGKFYNRLYAAEPSGTLQHYDKRHLFRMGHEEQTYTAGNTRLTLNWRGWRLLPLVCYDLRFPVWSRNTLPDGPAAYDLLLYVANWPQARGHHWRRLLAARAIENQCYVAAVNRVGVDAKGHDYQGDSTLLNWHGDVLAQVAHTEAALTLTLEAAPLLTWREKFPFWMDADRCVMEK